MAVRLAYASLSETGGINGAKGDQNGAEVKINNWYRDAWTHMFIHPDPSVREKHAKAAEAAAKNPNIGYGQSDRNSLYQEALKVNMDFSKITTPCNCDCSSFQNACAVASGAPGLTYGANGWTVTTLRNTVPRLGYKTVTNTMYLNNAEYCVRGAIIITSGHAVCAIDNGSKYQQTLASVGLSSSSVPITPTVPSSDDSIEVGEIVNFTGTKHYPSASSVTGKVCSPGKAKVSSLAQGKPHPYHLIAVKPGDSTVFGWVDVDDVEPIFEPYVVRVTIDDLYVRTGPGTNYPDAGFCPVGAFTIVKESDGQGATKWGKLKSGIGWISLDYVQKT